MSTVPASCRVRSIIAERVGRSLIRSKNEQACLRMSRGGGLFFSHPRSILPLTLAARAGVRAGIRRCVMSSTY